MKSFTLNDSFRQYNPPSICHHRITITWKQNDSSSLCELIVQVYTEKRKKRLFFSRVLRDIMCQFHVIITRNRQLLKIFSSLCISRERGRERESIAELVENKNFLKNSTHFHEDKLLVFFLSSI